MRLMPALDEPYRRTGVRHQSLHRQLDASPSVL
jgi:hypothetical protein